MPSRVMILPPQLLALFPGAAAKKGIAGTAMTQGGDSAGLLTPLRALTASALGSSAVPSPIRFMFPGPLHSELLPCREAQPHPFHCLRGTGRCPSQGSLCLTHETSKGSHLGLT